MAEIIVVKAPVEENLSDFSRYLWQQQMPHRILLHNDIQLLLVGSESDAVQVAKAFQLYQDGEINLPDIRPSQPKRLGAFDWLKQTPVTLVLLLLSIAGYFLVITDHQLEYARYLTFFDIELSGRSIQFSMPSGEYWRLITPAFLHFSVLHIVFNGLWLWELGRRIEVLHGGFLMAGITVFLAIGSNLAQAMFAEAGIFGGMSGVIYGLLAYGWIWSVLCPHQSVGIPKAVFIFMLLWMVLCMTGFVDALGAGSVANAAHVGGFVMGLILGGVSGLVERSSNSA